jgi:hypothetical protein
MSAKPPISDILQTVTCNGLNEIYDSNINTCVSCRDPVSKPIKLSPIKGNVVALTTNNDRSYNANSANEKNIDQYKCINGPIKTYDATNKLISQTCDSSEQFVIDSNTKTATCVISFFPKKK